MTFPSLVMAGLDPAIHLSKTMDARIRFAHDHDTATWEAGR